MIYKTNSLQLASYLHCQTEVVFKGIDKTDMDSISFLFDPQEEAEKLTDLYFSGKAIVNPLDIFNSYKILKDRVFEAKRNTSRN